MLGAVVALMLAGSVHATASARPRQASHCSVHYVAHRGEGWPRTHTEDGAPAIRAAIKDPDAYAVESDAWVTSDGRALMQHDDKLSISTDGRGRVSAHSLAFVQKHYRMNDGSRPESALGYLRQVVAGHEHAILHLKSSRYNGFIDKVLTKARARTWVRPMATSLDQARYFVRRNWHTELLVDSAPSRARVAAIKATGVTAVLVSEPSGASTPAAWIKPYLKAGITTDYVAFSAGQDRVVSRYPFDRVLSGNIARTASRSDCPATAK